MRKFLQGMGVGILLTTLVFAIAYFAVGKRDLTDAQIIARAKKLGMVEPQETIFSNSQDENQGQAADASGEGAAIADDGQAQAAPEGDKQSQDAPEEDKQSQDASEDDKQSQDEREDNASNDHASKRETRADDVAVREEGNETDETISFTIERGEGATQVSRRLQDAGLVDSALDFDRYLRNNSISRTIQIGTFDLHAGMSYEELADVISGR